MSWPRNLVLVRHAESEGNTLSVEERARYDLGTHAYQLTAKGRRQAGITGQYLRALYPGGFDVCYVSYYARSRETMRIMFPEAKVYEDPRLAEAQRGIWHVLSAAEVEASPALTFEISRRRREGLYHYRPLGGENWPDVELRIHSFLGTLSRDYGDQNVLMVVHGHWLILFQRLIEHFSIEEALRRYQDKVVANASVTTYAARTDDQGRSRLAFVDSVIPWNGQLG